MANGLFTPDDLALLVQPERWRLVTSFLPPEAPPVTASRQRTWRLRHSERHPQPEILFALTGKVEYGLLGQAYPCTPGTMLLFDAQEEHDRGYPPGAPVAVHLWLTLLLDRTLVRRVEVQAGRWRTTGDGVWLVPSAEAGLDMRRLLTSSRSCAAAMPAVARSRLQSGLALFLSHWLETLQGPAESAASAHSPQADIVNTLCRHLRETGGNAGTLDNLARIAGYSKYHFWRLFKRHTGSSLHEFVDRCRLDRVRELRSAGRSWKQISAELGFSCPSAFSRWYRPYRTAGVHGRSSDHGTGVSRVIRAGVTVAR